MQSLAEHFTTIRVLGEGGFGIVKLVKSRQDGQVCNSPYLGGSVRQCTCGIEKTEICLYAYHLFVAIRRQAVQENIERGRSGAISRERNRIGQDPGTPEHRSLSRHGT